MQPAIAARLPDGRMHLQHGPIDLLLTVEGPGKAMGEQAAAMRFGTILTELANELPVLRQPFNDKTRVEGAVATRMIAAVNGFQGEFITPMAAVAGAVADEVIAAISTCTGISKAIANNGGDVALYLDKGQKTHAAIAGMGGELSVAAVDPWRGVATSGWRGRSWSLGIADAVTVIARTAAAADSAATMIANRIDLQNHPAITRALAQTLDSESDLAGQLVTTDVGCLQASDIKTALDSGALYARDLIQRGMIGAAVLFLQGHVRQTGEADLISPPAREALHA